jgi:hypothetical protein
VRYFYLDEAIGLDEVVGNLVGCHKNVVSKQMISTYLELSSYSPADLEKVVVGAFYLLESIESDKYHTREELYEFRMLFNAALFNEWYAQDKYAVHKSLKHSDGEDCFGGGWFIVVATLPGGDISNHYAIEHWDLFNCEVRERAKEFDGHTSEDVLDRLRDVL